ncbi:MAG: flagellar hook-basal body complex protein FliE [Candidatus Omnitrophica bacterium]|nr:flagellar hook-basal body complex protein FliE [Candidatus Omnitrophota bacterium]
MDEIQGKELHLKPVMPRSILPNAVKGIKKHDQSFIDTLNNSIQEINKLQENANQQVEKLARGEIKDVHQVMIAAQEANLAFSMMMQIRNKIVDAYQEVIKMG